MNNNLINKMKKKKVAIGMVHLKPLPGSPDFKSLNSVIKRGRNDAEKLQKAGFDAIMIENFGDTPFYKEDVPKETLAAFAVVAEKIKEKVRIPVGINVLRNDPFAALAIANAIGAEFIRINVFISAALTDQGIIEGKAAEIIRYREKLNPNIAVMADVGVKHSYPLTGVELDLAQEAKEAACRGRADLIIISGKETGSPPTAELVRKIREKMKNIKLVQGSGADLKNIREFKDLFDAVIIGTSIKKENQTTNPVDLKKAKEFIRKFSE